MSEQNPVTELPEAKTTDTAGAAAERPSGLPASAEPGARRGALGKALIAYLATGSIGVAIVVFLIAKGMGC